MRRPGAGGVSCRGSLCGSGRSISISMLHLSGRNRRRIGVAADRRFGHLNLQDAEKVRQRHSRKTLPPHRLGGVYKRGARYSARREPQKLTVRPRDKSLSWQARGGWVRMNDSPLHLLQPCWTAFLRILRSVLIGDGMRSELFHEKRLVRVLLGKRGFHVILRRT